MRRNVEATLRCRDRARREMSWVWSMRLNVEATLRCRDRARREMSWVWSMRLNVEAALLCRDRARREMPWLDTPEYVLRASDGELLCVSEPYKECAWMRGVFVFRDGQFMHHFSSGGEYDTSKMQRLVDYAGERGWL